VQLEQAGLESLHVEQASFGIFAVGSGRPVQLDKACLCSLIRLVWASVQLYQAGLNISAV
jgi:hypothetical protein